MRFDGITIFVTGGAGFIGSAVIRHLMADTGARIVNIDKLTYAANLELAAGRSRPSALCSSSSNASARAPACAHCSKSISRTP